jgi:ribA/ribD-fused uncharacterized protein
VSALVSNVAPKTGSLINRFDGKHAFLSNFYPAEIELSDMTYPTVEHAYQAAKTLDMTLRAQIMQAHTPGQAKRLGRTVPLRPDWEDIKAAEMWRLLVKKFNIPELRNQLLATGSARLVEGNLYGDRFWGIDLRTGEGENFLGTLLMLLRGRIKQEVVDGNPGARCTLFMKVIIGGTSSVTID